MSSSAPALKSRVAQNKPPGSTAYQLQAQIARCCKYAAQRRAPSPPPPNVQDKERLNVVGNETCNPFICQLSDRCICPQKLSYFVTTFMIRIINIFSITNCINVSIPLFATQKRQWDYSVLQYCFSRRRVQNPRKIITVTPRCARVIGFGRKFCCMLTAL